MLSRVHLGREPHCTAPLPCGCSRLFSLEVSVGRDPNSPTGSSSKRGEVNTKFHIPQWALDWTLGEMRKTVFIPRAWKTFQSQRAPHDLKKKYNLNPLLLEMPVFPMPVQMYTVYIPYLICQLRLLQALLWHLFSSVSPRLILALQTIPPLDLAAFDF